MKRFATFIAAAVLILLPGASALGQTKLTFAGGINLASMTINTEGLNISPESITRFALGASAEIPVAETWGIHVGGGYSQRGYGVSFASDEVSTKIDYFELSGLAGVPFSLNDRASLYLLAGPVLAFEVSCQLEGSFLGTSVSEDCDGDGEFFEESDRSALDLGLAGGARLEFSMSEKMAFSLGWLYNLGLLNMDTSDSGDSIKHRVMSIQAGIVYSIG